VSDGEASFRSFKDRVESEPLVIQVTGDWTAYDDQARYRSAGYVPETGQP
jgi:hypothetical protein